MPINVSILGETGVSVSVTGNTGVSVVASGGIGPAGFLTVPGTATNAFGTFQLVPGPGISVSTTSGQFTIASYDTAAVAGFAPVQSVAGRTGAVVLQAADVTAGTFAIARIPTISYTALSSVPTTFAPSAHTHSTADVVAFTAAASAAAPVQSVQSRTGAVVITRGDLTAAAEVHTHSTSDIVGLTASFSQAGHTHAASDVQSGVLDIDRIPTIGYTALSGVPSSFTPSAHTHSTADIVAFTAAASSSAPVQSVAGRTGAISLAAVDVSGLANVATSGSYTSLSDIPLSFAPATHTHQASEIASGTLDHARLPTISYTALSNTAHTHSTSDISGYQGLPAQAGYAGPLVTDGTNATWTSRYSIVSPVLVQGDGMTFTRDTSAGSITIAYAGGTSGLTVGSATPQPLGTASAGTSSNASREDHVHKLPTVGDITAAAAIHTHAAGDIQSGTLAFARLPSISYTSLANVPVSFVPSTHTHDAADITTGTINAARLPGHVSGVNGLTGTLTIAAGSNVTVSTAGSTITIASGGGSGSAAPAARSLHFVFRT